MNRAIWCGLAACALLAMPVSAEVMTMRADLKGSSEVPATTSPGTGKVDVSYDTTSKALTWTGSYAGLTGPATAAHFHGPAEAGKNAPVLIPAPAPTASFTGSATLTEAQAADLMGGRMYFNIHTAANPGGEIRGQVVK